jgi:hypothetical protein
MATAGPAAPWETCTFCGDAVPPDATMCPTCGKEQGPPAQRRAESRTRPIRRRLVLLRWLRALVVVAIVAGIGWAILSAELSGPTTYPDPLTGSRTFTVPPAGWSLLAGNITGEDFVTGNFSVMTPTAAEAVVLIFNASEFQAFASHETIRTVAPPYLNVSSARIVFAAPYTDEFYFVFENPYPATSGITETIFVSTTYETNVVLG